MFDPHVIQYTIIQYMYIYVYSISKKSASHSIIREHLAKTCKQNDGCLSYPSMMFQYQPWYFQAQDLPGKSHAPIGFPALYLKPWERWKRNVVASSSSVKGNGDRSTARSWAKLGRGRKSFQFTIHLPFGSFGSFGSLKHDHGKSPVNLDIFDFRHLWLAEGIQYVCFGGWLHWLRRSSLICNLLGSKGHTSLRQGWKLKTFGDQSHSPLYWLVGSLARTFSSSHIKKKEISGTW